jgi:7,8-dihydropterin-6-yl-methyl-4-(beta-D-ribofuranosyl)aminobenzene 5'-phosphate synthase
MIIKTLVENTSLDPELGSEHGLSLYIETENHRILFDTGASGLFAVNAEKMGIDLSLVDIAVISHDHYDHGGGLMTFMALNKQAKIYVSREAFQDRFSILPTGEKKFIGLDKITLLSNRFQLTSNYMAIDEELELFSGVNAEKLKPSGNKDLFMMGNGLLILDDFAHEQNLIIREKNNIVLVAGCAHNGIVNIIDHMKTKAYGMPSHVIGGFHMYNKSANQFEDPEKLSQIGTYLKLSDSLCYTCHCTGIKPYQQLQTILGDQIGYLATGSILNI